MKICQLAFITNDIARGMHIYYKEISELDYIDTYVYKQLKKVSLNRYNSFENYSYEKLYETLNKYDIILFHGIHTYKRTQKEDDDLHKFLKVYHNLKHPTKIYIEHEFFAKKTSFDSKWRSIVLKSTDSFIYYYKDDFNWPKYILNFLKIKENNLNRGRIFLKLDEHEKHIRESFEIKDKKPYIFETGFYSKHKMFENIIYLQEIINKNHNNFKYKFFHMGVNFDPNVFFNYVRKNEKYLKKYGSKVEKYFDENFIFNKNINDNKVVILGSYDYNFMIELFKRIRYTWSLMTTLDEKFGKYVIPRFEYAQIEKCLYTIPIMTKDFIELFDNMDKSVRDSFLLFDMKNQEKSGDKIVSEINYLDKNEKEYNERRKNLIEYIRKNYDLKKYYNFISSLKKDKQKNKKVDFDTYYGKSLGDLGLTYNIFKKDFEKRIRSRKLF